MKDTEREKTTAELTAWQAQLTAQRGNQNKLKATTEKQENGCLGGGKIKVGKGQVISCVIKFVTTLLGFGMLMKSFPMFRSKRQE